MKTIHLGDIHGRTIWKDIVNQEECDKIVFIGDYVDTHENITPEQQLNNLADIIQFKKDNTDKVILLMGNHDYHYLDMEEHYSGYQPSMQFSFERLFRDSMSLFQMAYLIPDSNILCTHAGVSKTWCHNHEIQVKENSSFYIIEAINDLFKYKPKAFRFTGSDMYGDSIQSSPIWIRENSLSKDKIEGFIQIVGHTAKHNLRQKGWWNLVKKEFLVQDENIWMIDTLGTSKEYLSIENNQFTIKNL